MSGMLAAGAATAQTQRLNDTGIGRCANTMDSGVTSPCSATNSDDLSALPRQDGRFGRDVAGMSKVGGGSAGFDFTRLCWSGLEEGQTGCTGTTRVVNISDTAYQNMNPGQYDWACTRDNVTGLVWSLQTRTLNWSDASSPTQWGPGHNTASRCGYSSGWRLPRRHELLSVIHNGVTDSGSKVDRTYIILQSDQYWTDDTYAADTTKAWLVNVDNGLAGYDAKTALKKMVLVRGLP
jgi:hypothetical protein